MFVALAISGGGGGDLRGLSGHYDNESGVASKVERSLEGSYRHKPVPAHQAKDGESLRIAEECVSKTRRVENRHHAND